MSQINFLQVGDTMHCLRCHQEIAREDIISHCGDNGTCPKLKEVAKFDYNNCAKCLTYKGTWLEDKYL